MTRLMPDLHMLVAYHDWANRLLLDAVSRLSEEEWKRDLGSSFPSVQSTAAHIAGTEWIWLERWQGRSPTEVPEWMIDPDPALLRSVLDEIESARRELLHNDDFHRDVSYRLFSGLRGRDPLGALVLHVVNHASYHRGQLVTMLRQLGKRPPSTDLIVYLREVQNAAQGSSEVARP